MSGFQKEYEIQYFQIDQNQEATPLTILQFLEDTAIFHSADVGLSIRYLYENRVAWVLNRWLLKMDRYPKLGEKILVKTWPSNFERFYGTREFSIMDQEGNVLGGASSQWIYLNIDKRRPIRIPTEFGEKYGLAEEVAIVAPFREFPKWVEAQSKIRFHVRKSDIDTNGHVNNIRYLEWMLEGIGEDLSQDLTQDHLLCELEVIYKKETVYGSDIISECQSLDGNALEYSHRILSAEDQQELAVGRTAWRRR